MRTAQVAAAAGVNVQTLRYYERRGLLPAPARLSSGYRAYGADAVRTVRFVKRAQRLGFTLEEIDALLELSAGGPDSCPAARALAAERISQLDSKIATLQAMRDSLVRLVASCDRLRDERSCPLVDAIGGENVAGAV